MPAQSLATRAARAGLYLDVIRHMHKGETQEKACEGVGVSVSAFVEWRDKDPDAISTFQDILSETHREEIADILLNRTTILRKMIDDAMSDDTKPMERVAIFKAVEEHLDKLVTEARLGSGNSDAANDVLGGPILQEGVSRFALETEVTRTKLVIDRIKTDKPEDLKMVELEFLERERVCGPLSRVPAD